MLQVDNSIFIGCVATVSALFVDMAVPRCSILTYTGLNVSEQKVPFSDRYNKDPFKYGPTYMG